MKFCRNFIALFTLGIISLGGFFCFGENSTALLRLEIQGLGLIIGTPANINMGSLTRGEHSFTFDDYFWIEDLRGNKSGHYTSIQCDGFYGPDNYVITGVQFKANGMELIGGTRDDAQMYSLLTTDFVDTTEPKIYFYRNENPANTGYVNKYGDKPTIKFTIPSDAPTGSYKGKITYTLYDMETNI